MNICIIGDGLSSLTLAKNLINKKINVHIYQKKKVSKLLNSRTIGISKTNFEFLKKEILPYPQKKAWEIKKIEIFSEKLKDDKILNFENNNNLFYMVRNKELYDALNNHLIKSKYLKKIKIKNDFFYQDLLKKNNYDLIINCDSNNFLTNKYFFKRIKKDYHNFAYTTILKHKKLNNKTAIQIFTKYGPIAFLPISDFETSVVYSIDVRDKKFSSEDVLNLIKKYNPKFDIKTFSKLEYLKLKSSNLRNYHYKNILAFGDLLHKIHPLVGQGFNMTIRDIKILSKIIQNRINLGLQLDSLICEEFEKKTKHTNFIFSSGVNFIYEFFNFDKNNKKINLSLALQLLAKNKKLNNYFIKYADAGLII